MSKLKNKNILVILTGSIACYKSCSVISKLKQQGHSIKVVLSPSSLQFIGAATIEGLTGEPPLTDMYSAGHAMDHISLARWADLILAAPATANYINKISNGIGDDLLTTLFLAHDFEKPFLIAPAMNTKMYLHPVTQESIKKLKQMKVEILETASGVLACGEVGSGKLLDPELIVEEVEKNLGLVSSEETTAPAPRLKKIKVLITSGGTTEPIDDVRVLTNRSTGKTASVIANILSESGLDVTYIHSQNAIKATTECRHFAFETFSDLQKIITDQLLQNNFAYVIHAAAVGDYSLEKKNGKLDSSPEELHLTLKRNPKIVNTIKQLSPRSKLFAFKLTSGLDDKNINSKVSSLIDAASCDLVIQNDWRDVQSKNNRFKVFDPKLNFKNIETTQNLGAFIFQEIMSEEAL